uniref:Uncharacterized protein n=1 Tax=Picea glauca TaxID=3330 RepID=A0A117NG90_PICGL|nr:hypothetical protein ABT39_MTgene1518 [Picea glauca]
MHEMSRNLPARYNYLSRKGSIEILFIASQKQSLFIPSTQCVSPSLEILVFIALAFGCYYICNISKYLMSSSISFYTFEIPGIIGLNEPRIALFISDRNLILYEK